MIPPPAYAGIAADLKTFSAHNCYGIAAITALTVQSTQGVKSVHDTPAAELRAQLDALLEDIKITAIKIGMLGHRGNAVVVGEFLDRAGVANVVLDPVMKSTSGATDLVDAGGIKYIAEELLKRATVVTPNIAEAEILSGITIKDHGGMETAARKIVERGARAVVIKGGHMDKAIDVLFDGAELLTLGGDHIKSENTHGSGCTFARRPSAAQLACGRPLQEAVLLAKAPTLQKPSKKGFSIGKGPWSTRSFLSNPPGTAATRSPRSPAARHASGCRRTCLVLVNELSRGRGASDSPVSGFLHARDTALEMFMHFLGGAVMHAAVSRQYPLKPVGE